MSNKNRSDKLKIANQKFKPTYSQKWPCLRSSEVSLNDAFCTVCNCNFSVKHSGFYDCARHIASKKHQSLSKIKTETKSLTSLLVKNDELSLKTTKAEMLFSAFLVEHNLPLSAADHAALLFKNMFPDSEIAKGYSCARTKSSAIIKSIADTTVADITAVLRSSPFSMATDGSTDLNSIKLYPVVVRYFDIEKQKIISALLSILESSDNTGHGIFSVLNKEMENRNIPWKNCVAFGCDNASTMLGHLNGVAAHIKKLNCNVFVQGCLCHLLHICAQKSAKELNCEVESLLLDIYFYIDKSSKRKKRLLDCQELCGMKPYAFLKYVSTRWLSLLDAINRLLSQWDAIIEFFCSKSEDLKDNDRVRNVKKLLQSPDTKLYLLFLQATLPMFTSLNLKLQSDIPMIHLVRRNLISFFTDLLVRFVKPSAVPDFSSNLNEIKFKKLKYQKANEDIVIGSKTRAYLVENKIGETEARKFYCSVRKFYERACTYAIEKLPLHEDLLKHAEVADPVLRKKISFSSVQYFVDSFPGIVNNDDLDSLEIEFSRYQADDLETDILLSNADIAWTKISNLKDCNGAHKYIFLPRIMLTILLVPHSNAVAERIFSIVRNNMTEFRSRLSIETLNALLVEKINMLNNCEPCYNRKFSKEDIQKAKHATVQQVKQEK